MKKHTGKDFPTDPMEQVWGAIGAVFNSWMNDRAAFIAAVRNSPRMGDRDQRAGDGLRQPGDDCATGVGLTRDFALGLPGFNGDYLINAQGEDVVAGSGRPSGSKRHCARTCPRRSRSSTNRQEARTALQNTQDIEFTIQRDKVWMLQTRNAKRTGFAAVRMAVDIVKEGMITEAGSVQQRIPADDLNQLLQPIFDPKAKKSEPQGEIPGQGHSRRPRSRDWKNLFPRLRGRGPECKTTRSS